MLNKLIKASSGRHLKCVSRRYFANDNKDLCTTLQKRNISLKPLQSSLHYLQFTKFSSPKQCIYSFCTTRSIGVESAEKRLNQKVQLQDWQYVREISESIKSQNTNNAFNLIIQSYLANQVLDIQIYHSVHLALCQEPQNFPLGYHQVLYKIYRSHFEPHLLLADWMHRMAQKSRDDKLRLILYKDYQTLGLDVPIFVKSEQKKPQSASRKHRRNKKNIVESYPANEVLGPIVQQEQKDINNTSGVNQSDSTRRSESYKIPELQFQMPTQKGQYKTGQEKSEEGIKFNPNFQQVQSFFEQILKYNCRVVFHNIEINYDPGEQALTQDQDYYDNDEDSYYDQDEGRANQEDSKYSSDNSTTFDISPLMDFTKISIGKLQLFPRQGTHNSDKHDNQS